MSTSDFEKSAREVTNLADGADSVSAVVAGLPDPSALARLANEFLSAIPAQPGVASTALPAPPVAVVPAGIPSETDLQSLPALLPTSAFPGIPGGFSTADVNTSPSFSFIDEARSLFAGPPAVPVHAVPLPATTKIPTETEVKNFAPEIPGANIPSVPASKADLTSPAIPGSVPRSTDLTQPLGFLGATRQLESINTIPTLEAVSLDKQTSSLSEITSGPFDVNAVRRDFPILKEVVNGRQIIWLDNAATTQKPQAVIDRLAYFYAHENSNVHRAAHTLAARSTDAYEAAREKVRRFLNASSVKEIIFVRGATEGINLVAQSWGKKNIHKDDEIILTHLEHHANIVPWQMLAAEKGARIRVAPVDNTGQIILEEYEKLFSPRTRLVALPQVSNALGTVTPVREMVEIAHRHGAKVLVDGAQSVSHMRVDVQDLDPDFFVFSGHKVFAPTGIGVVYGKSEVLENTPPYQGGGNMISDVTFEKTQYHGPPLRFEAGTGNIADAVGLGAAIDYVERVGMINISRYEHDLLVYGTEALTRIPGLHLIGTAKEKASVLSFVLDGFRTEDVGAALSQEGIAVRSGHHCAQPILRRFGVESTVRPSLAFYNTCEEIDALVAALWRLKGGRGPTPI